MQAGHRQIPPVVMMLTDHLDAALAYAEDLRGQTHEMVPLGRAAGAAAYRTRATALRAYVETLRRSEALLITRVLTARQRLAQFPNENPALESIVRLFVAGTAPLSDAVDELRDATLRDFETGDDAFAYLTQHGVIDGSQSLDAMARLSPGEDFLVARRIHLGTLMDLLATFLDALDIQYDLYPDAPPSTVADRTERPQAIV